MAVDRSFLSIAAALVAIATLVGCASQPGAPATAAAAPAKQAAPVPERPFPEGTLYDLLVAEIAGHRGDYGTALNNYLRQARVTRDPQVVARAVRLAQYLGAWRQGADVGKLWTEIQPDNLEAHFLYGLMLSQSGDLDGAFGQMQQVGRLGGRTSFTTIAVEALKSDAAVRRKLLERFDTALAATPDNVDLMLGKAVIVQVDDPASALVLATRARKAAPDSTQAVIVESNLLQQLKRDREAATLLKHSLATQPENTRLRLQYARLLSRFDLNEAKQQFELLTTQVPDDPDLIFSLGLICRELKQYGEAEIYFRQLLGTGERQSEAHYYIGLLEQHKGELEAAAKQYQQVAPGADYLPAMAQLAGIRLGAGQYSEFHEFLAAQRQKYRKEAERLYVFEADILVKTDQPEAAWKLLSQAIDEHGDQLSLLYTRAVVNEKRGRYDQMESDLRKILARDPDNATALNALGYTLTNHGSRYHEALAMISRALKQRPDDPAVLDSMGWVQYRLGHRATALDYLRRAYKTLPDPEIGAHLGEVLWQDGKRDEALKVWGEALDRAPDNRTVTEAMQRLDAHFAKPAANPAP